MNTTFHNRTLLATVLGALLATGFAASAEPRQPSGQDRHEQSDQQAQKQKKQKAEAREDRRESKAPVAGQDRAVAVERRRDAAPARQQIERRQIERTRPQLERRQAERRQAERTQSLAGQRIAEQRERAHREQASRQQASRDRVSSQEHQRRIEQQRHRDDDWRRYSQSRERVERERAHRLQQQRRVAQYRYQQEYYRRLRAQQSRLLALRYDYGSNPYFYLPASYRYGYGGNWYSTNRYGADMLRQAVNRGYQEGLRAGRADRYDRWRGDYRDSFAWIDGSYGYDNYYVSRGDYQHYFRQGFQRGYEDGYYGRSRYGRYDDRNDTAIILGAVLAAILNLQSIG